MSKTTYTNKSSHALAKEAGRSNGVMVTDPVLNDVVTEKILKARKSNRPVRYESV